MFPGTRGRSRAGLMGLVVVVTEGQGSWGRCSPGRGHQEVEVSILRADRAPWDMAAAISTWHW